jgi:peptide/nickel transport system substrate-binding protein
MQRVRILRLLSLSFVLIVAACTPAAAPAPTSAPAKPTTAPGAAATTAPAAAPTAAPAAKPTTAPAAAPAPTSAPAAAPTQPAAATKPTTAPATAANLAGTLRIDTTSEIESPHPFFASQLVGISVRMNVFDSLVDREWDGKIVPALAESWNVVDETTIDFKIRKGVMFHNGTEMTVDDIKASMDHLLDKEIKAPSTSIFASFKEIQVVDPQTVRLVLLKTDARVFDLLANNFAVLPAQYIKDVGAAGIAKQPIGTGPYKFVEWVKDDHLTLEANPTYWEGGYKGKPQVKTVVLRPVTDAATRLADLRSGAADLIMDVPSDQAAALKSGGFNVVEKDVVQQDYIYFDTTKDLPIKNKDVRQALNYAVDKETILQTLLGGFGRPLAGPLSSLTLGYNPDVKPYPYDPAKARALLASGGFPQGFSMDMDITTSHSLQVAEAVVAQLGDVGVNVKLNVLETAVYNDKWVKKQLSPLYYNRWNTFSDPALLDLLAGCKGFLSAYCNEEAQKSLDAGGGTLDQAKRDTAYKQAVKVLADDPYAIYLFQLKALTGVSSKVTGWKAHSTSYLLFTNAKVG